MKNPTKLLFIALVAGMSALTLNAARPDANATPPGNRDFNPRMEGMHRNMGNLPPEVKTKLNALRDQAKALKDEMRTLNQAMRAELKATGKKSPVEVDAIKAKYAQQRQALGAQIEAVSSEIQTLVRANLPPLPDNLKPFQDTIDATATAMKANRDALKVALQAATTKEEKDAALTAFRAQNRALRDTIQECRAKIRQGMRAACPNNVPDPQPETDDDTGAAQ